MRKIQPNVLLVEGEEEKRVLPHLIEANGVSWGETRGTWVVEIEPCNGFEGVLAPGMIETNLKASGRRAVGVLVDADADAEGRWRRIREHCRPLFPALPDAMPEDGLLVENEDRIRFGAWIMPDNRSRGMLETFLTYLRPEANERLLLLAKEAYRKARARGAPCKGVHTDKAVIHTWLAWQDPPGRQLHQAIMERILRPDSPHAARFVRWFRALFAV